MTILVMRKCTNYWDGIKVFNVGWGQNTRSKCWFNYDEAACCSWHFNNNQV